MNQTYLCKKLGVEEGGGCSLKRGLLAGDYSNTVARAASQLGVIWMDFMALFAMATGGHYI